MWTDITSMIITTITVSIWANPEFALKKKYVTFHSLMYIFIHVFNEMNTFYLFEYECEGEREKDTTWSTSISNSIMDYCDKFLVSLHQYQWIIRQWYIVRSLLLVRGRTHFHSVECDKMSSK